MASTKKPAEIQQVSSYVTPDVSISNSELEELKILAALKKLVSK
jgi:hypothetical protein